VSLPESTDEDLLDLHFHGLADEADRARLAARLQADAALRTLFAQRLRFESALHRACAAQVPAAPARPVVARFQPVWLIAAGVALAAGILAVVVLQVRPAAPVVTPMVVQQPAAVPAIRLVSGSLADVDGRKMPQIGTGTTVMVMGEEDAVIALADGSSVQLAAASQAVFHPAAAGRRPAIDLHRGAARFAITEQRDDFEVISPMLRILARSGRFSVDCQSRFGNRSADVSVESGQIEVEQESARVQLAAGERRQFTDPEAGKPNRMRDGTSVGLSEGHLLLRPGRGDDGPLESHAVADDVDITIDGQRGALAAIPAGTRIRYVVDAAGRIVHLAASGLVMRARIEDIDDDERFVLLQSGGGRQSLLLPLAARAVIRIDGAAASLGAVHQGDHVRVQLTVDGSAILGLTVWRRNAERERREHREGDAEDERPRRSQAGDGF